MGSTSDLPVMEKVTVAQRSPCTVRNERPLGSPHSRSCGRVCQRMPAHVSIKVIIAAAGMAAHLPGVIAASTPLPVIGVPIKSSLEGMDALLAIVQMPPGIPVATVVSMAH